VGGIVRLRPSLLIIEAVTAGGLLLLSSVQTPSVSAHPLDEFLQAMYVSLGGDQIGVEVDLTPGVLVGPQVVQLIDTNGDGQITEEEAQSYARQVFQQLSVELDGQPRAIVLTKVVAAPVLNLASGAGSLQLIGTLDSSVIAAGTHELTIQNHYAPIQSMYQSAVVLDKPNQVGVGKQTRDQTLQSLRVDFNLAAPAAAVQQANTATATATPLGGLPEQERTVLETLAAPAPTPGVLLVALVLSATLGALHGLTPGHGKALLASYLVGSRGTVRHAVFLGGSITFTHTISVIAIGVLALLAGQFIVPQLLTPALALGSGLLVVGLGMRLVRARWQALRHDFREHHHEHGHAHAHEHEHAHPHPVPDGRVTWRNLAVMGVSGGLTPCPEAIGILLIAIGLNRVALGLALIIAFSVGLAVVLCLLGLLLVRARHIVEHVGGLGTSTQRFLPLGSAVVVTLLGAGIVLQTALTYVSAP
jgi:nickel/cobalt transporter (NicO) family protein